MYAASQNMTNSGLDRWWQIRAVTAGAGCRRGAAALAGSLVSTSVRCCGSPPRLPESYREPRTQPPAGVHLPLDYLVLRSSAIDHRGSDCGFRDDCRVDADTT